MATVKWTRADVWAERDAALDDRKYAVELVAAVAFIGISIAVTLASLAAPFDLLGDAHAQPIPPAVQPLP